THATDAICGRVTGRTIGTGLTRAATVLVGFVAIGDFIVTGGGDAESCFLVAVVARAIAVRSADPVCGTRGTAPAAICVRLIAIFAAVAARRIGAGAVATEAALAVAVRIATVSVLAGLTIVAAAIDIGFRCVAHVVFTGCRQAEAVSADLALAMGANHTGRSIVAGVAAAAAVDVRFTAVLDAVHAAARQAGAVAQSALAV